MQTTSRDIIKFTKLSLTIYNLNTDQVSSVSVEWNWVDLKKQHLVRAKPEYRVLDNHSFREKTLVSNRFLIERLLSQAKGFYQIGKCLKKPKTWALSLEFR